MLGNPHIIFFDEPTNHLDIESVDALCDAIRNFNGGVVLVTHDARLITEVNCELWVVDQNATPQVSPFQGEFEDYKDEILVRFDSVFVVCFCLCIACTDKVKVDVDNVLSVCRLRFTPTRSKH